MKHFLLIILPVLLYGKSARLYGQNLPSCLTSPLPDTPTRLLRIYEDNDFLNIRGKGTDDAYTNGTRIDYFYIPHRPVRGWVDKNMPKAGDSSVNIYGWGIMQLIFTPEDLGYPGYQPDDYPWSGGLIATHTLYSYNPSKKYDLQTELVLGLMGPAALAEQTQALVHSVIDDIHPMGWGHQFRNDLLLNINLTAEKQLASWGSAVEVIGGGQVFAGTMMNGVGLYPLIRFGHMTSWFRGYLSQYASPGSAGAGSVRSRRSHQWQAYFIVKPEGQMIFTNALLEGGLFTKNPNLQKGTGSKSTEAYHDLRRIVWSVNYGAVVSTGNFSISFIQNTSSAMMKGLYSHEVGNISLYFSW